jgi:hypothetical protein
MSTSTLVADPRVADVRFANDLLVVRLRDGREISAPVSWFPRLAAASTVARANWRPTGAGFGVHWPDIDEDLSVEGLLRGERAPD